MKLNSVNLGRNTKLYSNNKLNEKKQTVVKENPEIKDGYVSDVKSKSSIKSKLVALLDALVLGNFEGELTGEIVAKLGAGSVATSTLAGSLGLGVAEALGGAAGGFLVGYFVPQLLAKLGGISIPKGDRLKTGLKIAKYGAIAGIVNGVINGAAIAGIAAVTGLPGAVAGMAYAGGKFLLGYALAKKHAKN